MNRGDAAADPQYRRAGGAAYILGREVDRCCVQVGAAGARVKFGSLTLTATIGDIVFRILEIGYCIPKLASRIPNLGVTHHTALRLRHSTAALAPCRQWADSLLPTLRLSTNRAVHNNT